MTKETLIKSALRALVNEQVKQGSVGYALEEDSAYEVSWKDVFKWLEKQPSDDCISRQDAIGIVARIKEMHIDDRELYSINYGTICDIDLALQQLSSVTPHPKMGRWVEENINEWSRKVFCSECGCLPPFEHISNGDVYSASGYGVINKTKFCPNCGAKMEVEE
jgi:hypothetical protein